METAFVQGKRARAQSTLCQLIDGFVLTLRTEGKAPRTIDFYQGNLRRFLWLAEQVGWPQEAGMLDVWHIRSFLRYVGEEENHWGLKGNGSESSKGKASRYVVWQYYRTLRTFFNWAVREGLLSESPMTHIRIKMLPSKVVDGATAWRQKTRERDAPL